MSFTDRSPLEYQVNSAVSIRRFQMNRAPTNTDFKQFKMSDLWLDTSSNDWWICCYKDATQAIWRKVGGTSAASEFFIPDAGVSPVIPDATNQVWVTGGTGITTTGGLNTITWDLNADVLMTVTAEDATVATPVANNLNIVGTATNGIDTTAAGDTLTVSMSSPFEGNFIFQNNAAATALDFWVINYDATAGVSYAAVDIQTPDGGDDPHLWWDVNGGGMYALGIDNSVVGDPLKLTDGITPSFGTEWLILDTPASQWSLISNNVLQEIANAGGGVNYRVSNTDATNIASNAFFSAETEAAGGDPFIHFLIGAITQEYSFGIDNTDDSLKVTNGASPSAGTTFWQMTTVGERTMPLQPAFLAFNSVTDANQTGAAAQATVDFDTEIFDQNADFAADTFTAPVTGRYRFEASVVMDAVTAAMTSGNMQFITSNRTYQFGLISPGAVRNSNNQMAFFGSVLADMDAGDTCYVTVAIANGAGNTAGIIGNAPLLQTFFSGELSV